MNTYFATGEVNGRLLNRPILQHDEDGQAFSRFELANRFMDDTRPCACVAYGAIAAALQALTERGTLIAVRGEIAPFCRVLPTGRVIEQENMLHITTFRIEDEADGVPAY